MQGYATELEELIAAEDRITEQSVKACGGDVVLGRGLAQSVMARTEKDFRLMCESARLMWPEVVRALRTPPGASV